MTSAIPNFKNLTLDNNFSQSSFQNVTKEEVVANGYIASVFESKNAQIANVMDELDSCGLIPENLIESETKFFYNDLGIDDTYFASESVSNIVSNILALYSAKINASINGNTSNDIRFKKITDNHAVYFESGNSKNSFEKEIDDTFLDSKDLYYRLESFNSTLPNNEIIKCHFVYKCKYNSIDSTSEPTSINSISDETFLKIATHHTKTLYSEVLSELSFTEGPVVKHYTLSETGELRVIIGFKKGSSHRYNSALSTLAGYYKLNLKRKYVENFSNDYTIISMYLETNPEIESTLTTLQLTKDASLLYCIPDNKFYSKFENGIWSIQECIYAHCGVIFATHFLNRSGPEFQALKNLLLNSSTVTPKTVELVSKIKERFNSETFAESYIIEAFESNSNIIQQLYKNFVDAHYTSSSLIKTLSYQRTSKIEGIQNDEQFSEILSDVTNDGHAVVLKVLYSFNKSILKTNFFITSKIALSFRLDASFLPTSEYPNTPFGMFFVVGSEFRGFHIRFRDVARGGIRIVLSRSDDFYLKNMRSMFDENYNLASTQQKKNKDIPEGGSKGVILVNPGSAQLKPKECFVKYIDSLLDLLILNDPSKEKIVDLYNKPEMLFMGPDENTAGFVDWATLHAKKRGAKFGFPWKAFFTGKSPTIGGIPHDEYGMTTLSVRAFTEGVYKKLDINDWSKINKLQMGGGDGDLGSNEIKLSGNEKYVGIVDGFGCIVDEDGIDKDELLRLANNRFGNNEFDRSKLGPKGYAVMVEDKNIKLPNGQIIHSGIQFRNQFHLKLQEIYPSNFINLWVPCGGRPNSIDVTTVNTLLDPKTGKSIIPIIIEGANLFITQAAKYILEDAGAIVLKDASANKGGVTSSSLEVLAALSFDDEGFSKKMCMNPDTKVLPDFYKSYVKQVQSIIVKNAENEFNMLWKLKNETKKSFADLSDELSVAINKLGDELSSSKELWEDDVEFRNVVLKRALPGLLLQEIGLENILKRVPEAYLKAIFATKLASEFVYTRGIDANPAKFLEFVSSLKRTQI
jgi:glutamate dehydrogenase